MSEQSVVQWYSVRCMYCNVTIFRKGMIFPSLKHGVHSWSIETLFFLVCGLDFLKKKYKLYFHCDQIHSLSYTYTYTCIHIYTSIPHDTHQKYTTQVMVFQKLRHPQGDESHHASPFPYHRKCHAGHNHRNRLHNR
jgi:hypothetical protein